MLEKTNLHIKEKIHCLTSYMTVKTKQKGITSRSWRDRCLIHHNNMKIERRYTHTTSVCITITYDNGQDYLREQVWMGGVVCPRHGDQSGWIWLLFGGSKMQISTGCGRTCCRWDWRPYLSVPCKIKKYLNNNSVEAYRAKAKLDLYCIRIEDSDSTKFTKERIQLQDVAKKSDEG